MAKKLKIVTPKTSDGITLLYDEKSQVVKSTTYAPLSALRHLETANAKRQTHLKHTITTVDVDDNGNEISKKGTAAEEPETPAPFNLARANKEQLEAELIRRGIQYDATGSKDDWKALLQPAQ